MRVVVCVKAVRSEYVEKDKGAATPFVLNPYDLLTLQHMVALKKRHDLHITCLCMGPISAEKVLTRTIALGADEAVLVTDKAFAGSDTFATSYTLAKAAKKMQPADIYLCGKRAVDGETGQVGDSLASRLGLPCVTGVTEIVKIGDAYSVVNRQTDTHSETVLCKLPILLVFQNFSLREDSLSLLSLKRAGKVKIKKWDLNYIEADRKYCGQEGSRTRVVCAEQIHYTRFTEIIEGSTKDKAKTILALINKQG